MYFCHLFHFCGALCDVCSQLWWHAQYQSGRMDRAGSNRPVSLSTDTFSDVAFAFVFSVDVLVFFEYAKRFGYPVCSPRCGHCTAGQQWNTVVHRANCSWCCSEWPLSFLLYSNYPTFSRFHSFFSCCPLLPAWVDVWAGAMCADGYMSAFCTTVGLLQSCSIILKLLTCFGERN